MKILVAGEIDFPAENRTAVLEGARDLIDRALAEKGCRSYTWTADPYNARRVHVFEEWDSAADFQAHLDGPAYRQMFSHLSGFSILGADTRKYRVDASGPVYGADGVATARFD
jgi:quinol monooxygenase YgiN